MSRAASGDMVVTKPVNNVYTVLVGIALLAELIGFLALMMKAKEIFPGGEGLF